MSKDIWDMALIMQNEINESGGDITRFEFDDNKIVIYLNEIRINRYSNGPALYGKWASNMFNQYGCLVMARYE